MATVISRTWPLRETANESQEPRILRRFEKLDVQALPAYHKALDGKPSLEMRRRLEDLRAKAQRAWWGVSGERLRSLRAIEALELAGTNEAREVLQMLAAGAEGARLTEEAKAALERLANGWRQPPGTASPPG